MATGDRDAYQLAPDRTVILRPVRAGEMAPIGPAEVQARYGVEPWQVPDFISTATRYRLSLSRGSPLERGCTALLQTCHVGTRSK